MVEHVEELRAEIDVVLFRHVELLPHRRIEIEVTRGALRPHAGRSERPETRHAISAGPVVDAGRAERRVIHWAEETVHGLRSDVHVAVIIRAHVAAHGLARVGLRRACGDRHRESRVGLFHSRGVFFAFPQRHGPQPANGYVLGGIETGRPEIGVAVVGVLPVSAIRIHGPATVVSQVVGQRLGSERYGRARKKL